MSDPLPRDATAPDPGTSDTAPDATPPYAPPDEASLRVVAMDDLDARARYKILTGLIVPRPIAWVATVDAQGRRNLAPFSYFNAVSADPPVVMISIGARAGARKDTLANVEATGSFVVHLVPRRLAEAMNATSVDAPHGVDEAERAGLTWTPSRVVAAPSVREAPVRLECEAVHVWAVEERADANRVVFGRVRAVVLEPALLGDDGRIDRERWRPIGRLAGAGYAETVAPFDLPRPLWSAEGEPRG